MMLDVLKEADEFLYRYGTTTTIIDPVRLIADMRDELRKHVPGVPVTVKVRKKPRASNKTGRRYSR